MNAANARAGENPDVSSKTFVRELYEGAKKYVKEHPYKVAFNSATIAAVAAAPVGFGLLAVRWGIEGFIKEDKDFMKNLMAERSTLIEFLEFAKNGALVLGGLACPVLMHFGVIGDSPQHAAERAKSAIVDQIRVRDGANLSAVGKSSYSQMPWYSWYVRENGEVKLEGSRTDKKGEYFTVAFSDGTNAKYREPTPPPKGYEFGVRELETLAPKP